MNPPKEVKSSNGIMVEEIRKAVRGAQMEAAREKLRETTRSCVSYDELVGICEEISGSEGSARELARAMDESCTVVILGGVVILRPDLASLVY
jgi:calcium uniporter protein, mitochondrial